MRKVTYLVTGDSTLLHVRRLMLMLHLHWLSLDLRLHYWDCTCGGLLEKVSELRWWLFVGLLGVPAHIFIRDSFHLVCLYLMM